MRRKKKSNLPKFTLSESASNFRLNFARNVKDPSLILKESCGQTKLEVLKTHPELGEWLRKRVNKWIKLGVDKIIKYGEEDIQHDIYTDLMVKSIPGRIKTGKWVSYLEPYLETAARGFFNNFLEKYYKDKDIQQNREDIEVLRPSDPSKSRKAYSEIYLSLSITTPKQLRQFKAAVLFGEGAILEQIAKEFKVSTKTVERDLEACKNKEFYDILKERIEEKKKLKGLIRKKKTFHDPESLEDQHEDKEVFLYGSYQCKTCKKIFLSPYKVTLEECKDHERLEEV